MKKVFTFLIILLLGSAFMNNLQGQSMTLVFNTNLSAGTTITLPLYGTVNVTVDWGDGTNDIYTTTGDKTHTYASHGNYTVSITGTLTQFGRSAACSNINKLTSVTSFGAVGLTSLAGAFWGAINLTSVPTSLPATVTNLSYMFRGATTFNHDISAWDVANVTTMSNMFYDAVTFNQNIGTWNVGNVTNMWNLFGNATEFNQDIGGWDVGSVTSMVATFYNATAFNQNIANWNVSNATNMNLLFYGAAAFNQDISGWVVSNVTIMDAMFLGATAFNQDIGNWNVSNVSTMRSMFRDAITFNKDIGSWNVSNVTRMDNLFYGATAFNQDIGNWDISNVTLMSSMFYNATAFNQDISNWDVSIVTNMSYMFYGASAFNQDIGGWNVGIVTNKSSMFRGATTFNQNIGDWNVTSVTDFSNMFFNKALSIANYDGLLTGWAAQNVQTGRTFHGGTSKYSAASARAILTSAPNNWTITDGGEAAYAVTYNSNTATGGTAPGAQVKLHGVTLILATKGDLVETGYSFAGWNTLADGTGTDYAEGAEYTANEAVTLYAKWDPLKGFTVEDISGTFTYNGSAHEPQPVVKDGETVLVKDIDYTLSYTSNTSAGTAKVTVTGTGNYFGTQDKEFTINPLTLTIGGSFTVPDKEHDGNTSATIDNNSLTLLTPVSGDVVTLIDVVAVFASADMANDIVVSIVRAALDGTHKNNYTLSLTGAPTTTASITIITGIETGTLAGIDLYPNPFSDQINITNVQSVEQVVVTNIMSQQVINTELNGANTINTSHLRSGIFIVTLHLANGQLAQHRMVKR